MSIEMNGMAVAATTVGGIQASRTLVDKFRDWDWRLSDLVHWVHDTCGYWIDNLGWIGWFAVFLVTLGALLSWDLTRGVTNAMLTKIANGTLGLVGFVMLQILTLLAAWTGNATIASMRNSFRFTGNSRKGGQDAAPDKT